MSRAVPRKAILARAEEHDLRLWIFRYRGVIPVPFVLGVAFLSRPTSPYDSGVGVLFDALGIVVMSGGLLLRAWAVGHAGAHTRSYKLRCPRLVTTGPYGYVRNPIYLGNLLIGLGVVVVAESWIALGVLLVVFWVEYGAIVSLEEEFLSNALGDRYREYCRHVRRWVPRLRPVQADASGGFSWRALGKEYQAALSAFGMAGAVELGKHLHRLNLL